MSTEMTTEELSAFYDNLSAFVAKGEEDEARDYLEHHVARLPKELKNRILGEMFVESLVQEAEETEAVAQIQEEGMTAIHALEAVKKTLQESQENGLT